MSVRKDGKVIAGTTVNPDLFDFKWADHILDDISWVRADTFSWQNGNFYIAMYNHLANDIQDKTSADLITETIGGVTIAYYLAADGHKIVEPDQEAAVVSIYNTVGVAWYYIVDVENARFKLPRTKFGFTGMRDGVGKYVAPGVPNITGVIDLTGISNHTTSTFNSNDSASSALYNNESITAGRYHTDSASTTGYNRIRLNASRSSALYGASDTIQPPATQMYLYFYAGNYTPDAVAQTAGLNTEMFNDLNAHKVIEFQEPTADNDYTWYRKYSDGWVEQGGEFTVSVSSRFGYKTVTMPVTMSNAHYTVSAQGGYMPNVSAMAYNVNSKSTTTFQVQAVGVDNTGASGTPNTGSWYACGVFAS